MIAGPKHVGGDWLLRSLSALLPIDAVASDLVVPEVSVVGVDNGRSGLDATRYLLEQGNQRTATITGSLDWPSAAAGLAGYRDALRRAG